ncbi:uncharacterized protein LOC119598661 isoform X1 [Penaeus monodon]|uniref:uncharacterized protein LOC119598661 isoform X1 n=2 Tax=Penaeus monodon TaxID=6687 RepID=UPI0018A7892B|nr:uncharacterized protein LOC119598661 isoform X1 [Penaeus monodon]
MAGRGGADDAAMAGFHDKNSRVVGTWKIIECVSLSGSSEATGIEGTEFVLSEAGDVTWTVTDGCDALPLFSCQMYEVYTYQNLQCYGNRTLLRFAAYNGHIIEFRLDQPVMSRDLMLLTYDGWFMLQCEKLSTPDVAPDLPYSLLPALSDGYFSDVTITARSGRKFEVHSIVLECSLPGMDWQDLSGLEDAVLETVLHYLYSCCLPASLTTATAQRTIAATQNMPGLEELRKKCDIFVKNTNLRNRLVSLMQEVQECVEVMVQLFNPSDPAGTSPSHLITVLKAALRQMAIGVVKIVELSQEFEHCGWRLTQEEQHEVMRYTRSQLPPLLATVVRLLTNVRASLTALNHHTRQQLAQQLVPEIHIVLQTVCVDVESLRTSLEHIIQASSTSLESAHSPTHLLAKSLRNDLHLRELQKLRILQENLTSFLNSLFHKREQFREMYGGASVRGVARIIEHFTEELPMLILRFEEAAAALEDMLEWSEFKFVFKGATSKLGSIVERLVEHRGVVEPLVLELVERVGHRAFTTSLQHLGLLAPSQHPSSGDSISPEDHKSQGLKQEFWREFGPASSGETSSPGDSDGAGDSGSQGDSTSPDNLSGGRRRQGVSPVGDSEAEQQQSQSTCTLSLVGRVCEPPPSRSNPLAINIARLLSSPQLSDMTFVVVPPAEDEASLSSSQEELDTLEGGEASKELPAKEPSPEVSEPQLGAITPPLLKVSSTVVRKVKKSLSLDRPSVRAVVPSQAYSLDCDAVTCSDSYFVTNNSIISKDLAQHRSMGSKHSLGSPREPGGSERSADEAGCKCGECECKCGDWEGKCERAASDVCKEKSSSFDDKKSILGTLVGADSHKKEVDLDLTYRLRHSVTMAKERNLEEKSALGGCKGLESRHLSAEGQGGAKSREQERLDTRLQSEVSSDADKSKVSTSEVKPHSHEVDKTTDPQHLEKGRPESTLLDSAKFFVSPHSLGAMKRGGRLSKSNSFTEEGDGPARICGLEGKDIEGGEAAKGQFGLDSMELKAHRVVVASRCEWFRRALLSGMREAIDRCIVVHGCSVQTFQLLLGFLYAGHVDCTSLPPDQMVDLLVLADHYGVDALKLLVESGLEQHVDDDSVVPLLIVAHHCNASHLKEVCVHHCVVNAVVMEGDALAQLPEDLRHHLTLALGKHRKWCSGAIGEDVLVGGNGGGGEDSPLSVSSTDPLIDDQVSLIPGLQYGSNSLEGGLRQVETVVQQLREVVGHQVPRSTLVQITLAADYDLNRALNFFFASSS